MSLQFPPVPAELLGASFQVWWQDVVNALSGALDDLQTQITDIAALQSAMDDRITEIAAIQADLADQLAQILQAQETATAAAREAARINSYPNPGDGILHGSDAGSDATITVDDHTRVYPVQGTIDVPDVSITGGTITGLAFSTRYFVYYDDETLADTTPTFLATTNSATAQVGAAAGRHFIGYVDTPADGGTETGGTGSGPPGGGGGGSGGGIIP